MTHLRIEQSTSAIEQVSSAVVAKLYELATSGDLDVSSNLAGNIHTTATYQEYIDGIRQIYRDLYISTDNVYIKFQDSYVENVLKTAIGDGVGVTLNNAASVTGSSTIKTYFNGDTQIQFFDEFKFFTGLTQIERETFKGCSNLQSIKIPQNVFNIGYGAFEDCSSLSGVLDLSSTNIQTLGPRVFLNTQVTGLILPTTLQTYGQIYNSSPLSDRQVVTLKGFDNVINLDAFEFGNITNAIYFGQLTSSNRLLVVCSTDSSDWKRYSSIIQLYAPKFMYSDITSFYSRWGRLAESLFTYHSNETGSSTTIKLLYFKDLQSIKHFDFYCARIKNLVINNLVPPSFDTTVPVDGTDVGNYQYWINTMFGTIPTSGANAMIIYVPDSAVSTYQADSNYNSYTIRGINEINPSTNQPYLTRYATNDLWEAAGKPEDALIEEYM